MLLDEKNGLLRDLQDLESLAQTCFSNAVEPCSVVEEPLNTGVMHFVEVLFAEPLGWRAEVIDAGYDADGERVHRRVKYWPEFFFQNARLIRSIHLLRDGHVVAALEGDTIASRLEDSRLSFDGIWVDEQRVVSYCHRGDWTGYNNWAGDRSRHMNELAQIGSGSTYELLIVDIEGNETTIPVGNPADFDY